MTSDEIDAALRKKIKKPRAHEAAKKLVYVIHGDTQNRLAPILTMTNPAQQLLIINNNARYKSPKPEK